MNPEEMQGITPNQEELTPDEAAASLSFATMLSDQTIPRGEPMQEEQAPVEPSQEPENSPGGEEVVETGEVAEEGNDVETKMAEFESKLQEMEKSTKDTIRAEISGIKEMIQEALKDDE